jgi:hypothetical protein
MITKDSSISRWQLTPVLDKPAFSRVPQTF